MLLRRKIYIDSRYKTNDSITNANVKIQLNEHLKFSDNCGFFIIDICIPNTFKTVEEGSNDLLYMKYAFYPDGIMNYDIITIPARNYTGSTLAAELNILLSASVKQFYTNLPAAEHVYGFLIAPTI